MPARQQVKALRLHPGAEEGCVFMHPLPKVVALFQQLDRAQGGRTDRGRDRVREQIRPAALAQQFDNGLSRGGIAARGAAQSFAEGPRQDVDPVGNAKVVRCAAPMRPHKADGVAVVHHGQRVEFLCQIADLRQLCQIPIHRKHAVRGNEDSPRAVRPRLNQLKAEIVHIAVAVTVALCLAQADAVDDGGVVQLVGHDGVLRPQQRFKQAAVGIEAGGIENGVIRTEKARDSCLQCFVQLLRAADKAHGREPEAPAVIALRPR